MDANPDIRNKVLREQIAQVFVQFKTLPLVGVIGGSLLVLLLWDHVDQTLAVIWYIYVWIVYMGIVPFVWWQEKRRPPAERYDETSRRRALVTCLLDGSIWGGSAFALSASGSVFHDMALLTFILGAASIGAITYNSYRGTFYIHVFPIIVPFIIKFAMGEGAQYSLVALSVGFYLAILIWFNRYLYLAFVDALFLRFQLDEQKRLVESAKRAQTQLFAAASHDLRQPLHAYGMLATSLRQFVPSQEGQSILDTMSSSVEGMRSLLNSLLDISRLDAGAMIAEPRRFNIQRLLEQLALELESTALDRGIRLAFRAISADVVTDRSMLERILRNLLMNSLYYTGKGTVLLAARYRRGGVRLEVRDSGPGIPRRYHKKIFREYERITDTASDQRTGMGLGLAIVQRLAALLELPLGFRSEVGRGSIFYLDLPLADKNSLPTQMHRQDSFLDLDQHLIAVIDDNETVLFALRYLLESWGATVLNFTSGEEAMRYVDSDQRLPDLFLIDYRLPGEYGVDLIERLDLYYPGRLPVLMMTGDTAVADIQAFSQHAIKVLYKPVAPELLKTEIAALLSNDASPGKPSLAD